MEGGAQRWQAWALRPVELLQLIPADGVNGEPFGAAPPGRKELRPAHYPGSPGKPSSAAKAVGVLCGLPIGEHSDWSYIQRERAHIISGKLCPRLWSVRRGGGQRRIPGENSAALLS